jgi:hypothetical protein
MPKTVWMAVLDVILFSIYILSSDGNANLVRHVLSSPKDLFFTAENSL